MVHHRYSKELVNDFFVEHVEAAVYDIENGQQNRSAMERPDSGGTAYVITVSPVPVSVLDYCGDHLHWPSVFTQNMVKHDHRKHRCIC